MSHMFLFCRRLLFRGTHCPVFYIHFSLALGLNSLLLLVFTFFSPFFSSTHLFSPLFFFSFLITSEIVPLVLIWFLFMFRHPHRDAGLWLAAMGYVASCATDLSSGITLAVGCSLWSLGLGTAPPGPPAPGRLHRSISWAGTVHHMCDPTPPPPENSWCSIFLLTCTIKRSASTNYRWPSIKWLLLGVDKMLTEKVINYLPFAIKRIRSVTKVLYSH